MMQLNFLENNFEYYQNIEIDCNFDLNSKVLQHLQQIKDDFVMLLQDREYAHGEMNYHANLYLYYLLGMAIQS